VQSITYTLVSLFICLLAKKGYFINEKSSKNFYKYNFNGGACTLHFMPYQGGSAVSMRFSIAQLAGARYEKYAQDLTEAAANVIDSMWRKTDIDVDLFLRPENMVTPNTLKAVATPAPAQVQAPKPAPTPAPVVAPKPIPVPVDPKPVAAPTPAPVVVPKPVPVATPKPVTAQRTCAHCGRTIKEGDRFCVGCGRPVEPAKVKPPENVCGKCGAKTRPGDHFCCVCGNKL